MHRLVFIFLLSGLSLFSFAASLTASDTRVSVLNSRGEVVSSERMFRAADKIVRADVNVALAPNLEPESGSETSASAICGDGFELQGKDITSYEYCANWNKGKGNPKTTQHVVSAGSKGISECRDLCNEDEKCQVFGKYGAVACTGDCSTSWETRCYIIRDCGKKHVAQHQKTYGAVYCSKGVTQAIDNDVVIGKCNSFSCPANHYLRVDAAEIQCAGASCTAAKDQSRCCKKLTKEVSNAKCQGSQRLNWFKDFSLEDCVLWALNNGAHFFVYGKGAEQEGDGKGSNGGKCWWQRPDVPTTCAGKACCKCDPGRTCAWEDDAYDFYKLA